MSEEPREPREPPGEPPGQQDKAVSTDDLEEDMMMMRWELLEDVLTALVESKASAIKAECERESQARRERRGKTRAWRLLRHRSKDAHQTQGNPPGQPPGQPQAHPQGHQVTPMVHQHHHHHHQHHHHHPLHHHHLHQHTPITLRGSPVVSPMPSSSSSEVTINAGVLRPLKDLTLTGMCTTSDAPCLPSDETVTTMSRDSVAVCLDELPPLPQDPVPFPSRRSSPLRRTLSSRSHQGYHNYDYSEQPSRFHCHRATSWSCSATPAHSRGPSRAPSPPSPPAHRPAPQPEKCVSLTMVPDDEEEGELLHGLHGLHGLPEDASVPKRPRRKKRRRRAVGTGPTKGARKANRAAVPGAVPARLEPHDPDDLPKRARWTIAVTACLLLMMSMLLVGVTLRMAPIIDEMVRKENEEHMNMLNRGNLGFNLTAPVHDAGRGS